MFQVEAHKVTYKYVIGGSLVCGLAETSGVFIMARVLSGTGAAGILHGAMRILAFALPGAQRIYMEGIGAVMMGTIFPTASRFPLLRGTISG